MGYAFISYSRKDIDFVKKLTSDLQKDDYDIWYDQLMTGGESWADTLSKAIEDADVILVVLSKSYQTSQWAQKELQIGMVRESENKTTVIPLLIEQCEPPLLLVDKSIIDFRDYEHGFRQLSKTLNSAKSKFAAEIEGDGAIAQGDGAVAVGSSGIMISGDVVGRDIITH